jgi:two-component system, LytTR family, response regulator
MKILIVDDERKSRETLQLLIENYCPGVTVVGTAQGIDDALVQIAMHNPQLVLLDISMPGGTGFDLLKKISNINFEVIFITAFDKFGIEAIKANAIDYILKPVSIEELKRALQKAQMRLEEKNNAGDIQMLLKQLDPKPKQNKITVPSSDGLVFISPDEIIHLGAEGSYTNITLNNGKKVLSTRHLKEYENQLPQNSFIRVHHSYIINIEYVKHYQRGDGGYVIMIDGSEIMVSKRKKKDFLNRFTP